MFNDRYKIVPYINRHFNQFVYFYFLRVCSKILQYLMQNKLLPFAGYKDKIRKGLITNDNGTKTEFLEKINCTCNCVIRFKNLIHFTFTIL